MAYIQQVFLQHFCPARAALVNRERSDCEGQMSAVQWSSYINIHAEQRLIGSFPRTQAMIVNRSTNFILILLVSSWNVGRSRAHILLAIECSSQVAFSLLVHSKVPQNIPPNCIFVVHLPWPICLLYSSSFWLIVFSWFLAGITSCCWFGFFCHLISLVSFAIYFSYFC